MEAQSGQRCGVGCPPSRRPDRPVARCGQLGRGTKAERSVRDRAAPVATTLDGRRRRAAPLAERPRDDALLRWPLRAPADRDLARMARRHVGPGGLQPLGRRAEGRRRIRRLDRSEQGVRTRGATRDDRGRVVHRPGALGARGSPPKAGGVRCNSASTSSTSIAWWRGTTPRTWRRAGSWRSSGCASWATCPWRTRPGSPGSTRSPRARWRLPVRRGRWRPAWGGSGRHEAVSTCSSSRRRSTRRLPHSPSSAQRPEATASHHSS